jgi:ABC-type oligopeptide transport system substrate-binding subunit
VSELSRVRRVVLSALVLLAPLAGPEPSQAAPKPGGFDYAENGYVKLDPMWASTRPNDERLILACFDGLTRIDAATGKVAPAAAERWSQAPDGKSWTFTLRANAKWSDGTPVKAADFVRAWRRILDPDMETPSPWRAQLRPIRTVGTLLDADYGRRTLERLQKDLADEMAKPSSRGGVSGEALRELVDQSGLKAVVGVDQQPVLRRLLKWGKDRFPPKQAEEVMETLKSERRARKAPTFDTYDAFGTSAGALAKDDRTLVIETEGWVPSLPELLARATFVPFPESMKEARDIGDAPETYITNGPFKLHRRGARSVGATATPSVVHLVKNPTYDGPAPAKAEEVRCWTDEPMSETLRRFKLGELQWAAALDEEHKKELEALPGFKVRALGSVVVLRLRADTPPFDSRDARRAIALSVDRSKLVSGMWPAAEVAERIVPPNVAGATAGVRAPGFDAAAAVKALAATGYSSSKEMPYDLRYTPEEPVLSNVAKRLVGGWAKTLAAGEPGQWLEQDLGTVLRSGNYTVAMSSVRGATNDALAYLEIFSAASPEGGLGWKDDAFEAFLAGARDVDAAAASPDALLAAAQKATTKDLLAAVKSGANDTNRAGLRQALLAEAEQRLMDEAVVIPLVFVRTAQLFGAVDGLGSDAAWAQSTFVGSLRDVKPVK